MVKHKIKVWIVCTGVGRVRRGFESFASESFEALSKSSRLEVSLLKGGGQEQPREKVLWGLGRNTFLAKLLGKLMGRNAYTVEQWSSFLPLVLQIRKGKPDVIYYSDANIGFLLYRCRTLIGVPFSLLYCNGGPCHPPFDRYDFVQQVAPLYWEEAIDAGEPLWKHILLPHAVKIPALNKATSSHRASLRMGLELPVERQILLSVGWVSKVHKRMDYLIREVASLPEPRPFLQILGAMDESSAEIMALAEELLRRGNYAIKSVPYERVQEYYQAADVFALCSLQEGFGLVLVESLMYGLPTIGHHHPVIKYVLGDVGIVADLSQPGVLAQVLTRVLSTATEGDAYLAARCLESVRARFSWDTLLPQYEAMFETVANYNKDGILYPTA